LICISPSIDNTAFFLAIFPSCFKLPFYVERDN
jgi:hypothetical protein